jgi:D-glycero-D-manno-heptose 1,7-bisphosphate phosphatase
VFLDRDGTINVKAPEGSYITSPSEMVLLPGAASAIRRINDSGRPVFVVTNQRGVALGIMGDDDLVRANAALEQLLDQESGARINGFYCCTHMQGACDCRKPLPGLINRALSEHHLDAASSAMIGDAQSDIDAGRAAGVRHLLRLAEDEPDLLSAVRALGF